MSIVRINAITVPKESGDELARRFAARARAVDDAPGFEGFELLKPTDDRTTWLVVTRWKDEESFLAWVNSPAFGHGHRGAAPNPGAEEPAHGPGHGQADGPANPHGSGSLAVSSELWAYEPVVTGGPA
jgi:heme-degrading monooxygenase HmoA